jgi:predicted secreted protein with PEFG-CTERM motif
MAIALMALSLISMTSIQQDAFAQSTGMSITATTEKSGNSITVTGKTASQFTDITFSVKSPSGNNLVAAWQVTPDVNGVFGTEFKIGPTWTENGFYTITAKQGSSSLYTLDVLVEVTNGMTLRSTSATESNLQGIFKPNENNAATDRGIILDEIIVEEGSTMFEVTGMTDRVNQDITLKVIAPNGNVIKVAQISPMLNGEFATEITVGGSLWKQDGQYTVKVQQFDDPKYTASTEVGIKDGVVIPEFGAIAAMILAVAIISIIAISAKSRLSIMPRY